jgi:hypothetical protein
MLLCFSSALTKLQTKINKICLIPLCYNVYFPSIPVIVGLICPASDLTGFLYLSDLKFP